MSIEKKENAYNNESISLLKGADRVRLRPSVIFGSDGLSGCQHAVFEILANSIDEAREGFGDKIEITLFEDSSIMIKDDGRGIPLDYNEKEKRYNWELVFCELYAGGKYDNNSGETYEYSLGLNGLGSCAAQYSSEYMEVTVYRDGFKYDLYFEKGSNIGGMKKDKYDGKQTGTIIKWKPDIEVFTDIRIPISYFQETLKKQAVVNAGLVFILKDEASGETYEYCYKNGILDYIHEIDNKKGFSSIQFFEHETSGKDREDKPEYKVKMQIGFCFNNEINVLEYFHNSSFLEYGGAPDKAVKSAFVYAIDQYLKSENKYNKNEKKITFMDIEDSLILISNSFSTITSYENQTKKAITNSFIQEAMTAFLKKQLEIYFIENKEEADKISEQILINKRSREKAEKTRIDIKKKLGGKIDVINRVKKFVDCRTKDKSKRELYIVEGDSALGSCKLGRNAEFQAIMPVRGKILNCLKADEHRIFKSEVITDLLKVLGCGVELHNKYSKDLNTFKLDKLQWDKVIICTDADVDGYQIRTLILTMLYKLVPTLIKEGKVYIAETPLFEINTNRKTYFAYDEGEKKKILSQIRSTYTIQCSKGLGENDPDMMWETTMNPETRRLIRILPDDVTLTQETFEVLLGDNLNGRKNYISQYGYLYIEDLDVI